jgi:hypothetical protein
MAKPAVTMRLDPAVIDDINYLNYLMRAKSSAHVVADVIQLVAGAVKAAIPDNPELLRNGGTVLSREEQAAWVALVRDLRCRATPHEGAMSNEADARSADPDPPV